MSAGMTLSTKHRVSREAPGLFLSPNLQIYMYIHIRHAEVHTQQSADKHAREHNADRSQDKGCL